MTTGTNQGTMQRATGKGPAGRISAHGPAAGRIIAGDFAAAFSSSRWDASTDPLLLHGDATAVLKSLPGESIDFAMTSPPYWGKREYEHGGIGLETDYRDFVQSLAAAFLELKC